MRMIEGDCVQLFDILNPQLFRPLTGQNQWLFAELLLLLWDNCRTAPDYGIGKSELVRLCEDFLEGSGAIIDESDSSEFPEGFVLPPNRDVHTWALWCIARLKTCGWLEDLEVDYAADARTAVRPLVVPLLQAFHAILYPQTVTYSGKLNKAYQLLSGIAEESSPYENILREVSEAMDELNSALRNLNVSIGAFIDRMTQHRTPQEVLDLFEKYEEEIVVAAYQRFKTSDNLFNYKEALLEGLDNCQDVYLNALVADYRKVERCSESAALGAVLRMIDKIRDDLTLMGDLMAQIDKNHITYRQRAVQRAQFMLLSDGTTQGRINSLLRYYAQTLSSPASLFEEDDSPLSRMWRIYPTEVLGKNYLFTPRTNRKPTPIEPLQQLDSEDTEELRNAQQALLTYARSAVTMENVNAYAQRALQTHDAVRASSLVADAGDDFVKIIALHTYSQSDNRNYELELLDQWISAHGFRFQEFVIQKKV